MCSRCPPVPTTSPTFGARQNIRLKTRLMYETYSCPMTFLACEFVMRTHIHQTVMQFFYLSQALSFAVNTMAVLLYMTVPAALKTDPGKHPFENRLRFWLEVCEWSIANNYAVNIRVGGFLPIVVTMGDGDLDVGIDEFVSIELRVGEIKRIPISLVNPGQKFTQSRIRMAAVVVAHS